MKRPLRPNGTNCRRAWLTSLGYLESIRRGDGDDLWLTATIFDSWPYQPTEIDEDAFTIDNAKNLHLCFSVFSSGTNKLVYASDITGTWQHTVIDSVESDFRSDVQPSITVGRGGYVHLIFADPDRSVLYTSFDPLAVL